MVATWTNHGTKTVFVHWSVRCSLGSNERTHWSWSLPSEITHYSVPFADHEGLRWNGRLSYIHRASRGMNVFQVNVPLPIGPIFGLQAAFYPGSIYLLSRWYTKEVRSDPPLPQTPSLKFASLTFIGARTACSHFICWPVNIQRIR